MTTELYHQIRDYLRELIAGTEWEGRVYAVGGCCRDEIMGLPIKDIDLAVNRPGGGIGLAMWLYQRGLTVAEPVTFPRYGTAMLRLSAFPDDEIELVQTRKEKYTDATRGNPEVVFGSLEDDCRRRDLTINSLYYDISREQFVDLTGLGISDIENHIIRTPADPDMVYDDDPVRILRCIRFASRFGWNIDSATFDALKRNVDLLSESSPMRKQAELSKMLTSDHPVRALQLLRSTGAMRHLLPELCRTFSMKQERRHGGTVWDHTLRVVEQTRPDLVLRLAALLHDIGKVTTRTTDDAGNIQFPDHQIHSKTLIKKLLHRLKYPSEIIRSVGFLARHHLVFRPYGNKVAGLKDKRLRGILTECRSMERFDKLLELIDADNRALTPDNCMPDQADAIRERVAHLDFTFDPTEAAEPADDKPKTHRRHQSRRRRSRRKR